mmetsp:Transcript_1571/g.3255  ORF Transcript_1571/g.3255 Transcript_1571/m.3255 type:complete len:200 (-) Transcript_1571:722-1321(-)
MSFRSVFIARPPDIVSIGCKLGAECTVKHGQHEWPCFRTGLAPGRLASGFSITFSIANDQFGGWSPILTCITRVDTLSIMERSSVRIASPCACHSACQYMMTVVPGSMESNICCASEAPSVICTTFPRGIYSSSLFWSSSSESRDGHAANGSCIDSLLSPSSSSDMRQRFSSASSAFAFISIPMNAISCLLRLCEPPCP